MNRWMPKRNILLSPLFQAGGLPQTIKHFAITTEPFITALLLLLPSSAKQFQRFSKGLFFLSSFIILFSFLFLNFPDVGFAQGLERIKIEKDALQKVNLTVGKSVIIQSPEPVKRVSIAAAPEIAEARVLTPYQIYVRGKVPGVTNLTLWVDDKVSMILDLEVSPDISRLKEMISKIFPQEKEVIINATHDNITLSGNVSNLENYEQIAKLSESYFPKKVVNLMKIKEDISPASKLKEMIFKILPEEKDIKVQTTHNSITLSGTVSSASNLAQVLKLAETFLPKDGKLVNLLEVAGVHQVMLEVRVAEMSRSLMRKLGFNFSYLSSGGAFGLSLLNNLTSISGLSLTGEPSSIGVTSSINALFRFLSGNTTWTVFVDALKENGLLKVLAEPTLITLSGRTANFLAGGEFPIPVPQSAGYGTTITIEYKPYGVGLNFTPTVLNSKKIMMQVAPEVSELDFSRALALGGYVIPSLTTRRVSTAIELEDGQSFAIAGLLKEDVREIVQKFPILGDIPILGALFRSSSFQKNETELVVIVTPHLVKPLDRAKQTLPTDQFIEPDDFEFYLLGVLEGERKGKPAAQEKTAAKGIKLEGNFGHIVPK